MNQSEEERQRAFRILEEKIGNPSEGPRYPIGTVVWTPCSGMARKGTLGHTGVVEVFVGRREAEDVWDEKGWMGIDEARQAYPKIIEVKDSTLCEKCRTPSK